MSNHHQDTIVAIATPAGIGAIGMIRVSGSKAIDLVQSCFKGKKLRAQKPNTIHFGQILDQDQHIIDEVLVSLFHAPRSYTRENLVEISCHGSPYILQKICETLIHNGGRPAEPGEFTLRAFLNGQLDLSQAEAVADLIQAQNKSSHDLAMQQMRGGYSNILQNLRARLIEFASLVELELDFAEEDVEFAKRDDLSRFIIQMIDVIQSMIQSFEIGNVIKNGIQTVIAGRPNAGKSTLLNKLLNEERAIVSSVPGTTRDTIEEALILEGIEFKLIDTAGIREAQDEIEKMGILKTYEKIHSATLLLYIFDIQNMSAQEVLDDLKNINLNSDSIILIGNKTDGPNALSNQSKFETLDSCIFISAATNINLDILKQQMVHRALHGAPINFSNPIVSNIRHIEALNLTKRSLQQVISNLQSGISNELTAQDIRTALYHLGTITGQISSEDLLDSIFRNFCIGK